MQGNRLTKAETMLIGAGSLTWALVAWLGFNQDIQAKLPTLNKSCHIALYALFILLFLLLTIFEHSRKSLKINRLLTIVLVCCTLGLMLLSEHSLLPILLVLWSSLLPEFFSRNAAIGQILLANLSYYFILHSHTSNSIIFNVLIYMGFQLFAYSSSQARLSERESRRIQEHLNQQLIATRALLSQTSEQQERLRISRDLHDILGHQLTALSLQLELLSHQAPTELKSTVNQSKSLAKELLESIRAVVRAQRVNIGLDLKPPLDAIASRLPNVSLRYKSLVPLQSTELAQALLLVLQEGISNGVRHGKANQFTLSMQQQQTELIIQLNDNGQGINQTASTGIGLNSMQERLSAFNGKVCLQPNEDAQGCSLIIRLPQNTTM